MVKRDLPIERQWVVSKTSKYAQRSCIIFVVSENQISWLSTAESAKRLGVTPRTLYRFIDEGQLPAYRFGRVIRLKAEEVDEFIEACRIEPGTLEHLYPEAAPSSD
jgi:excisionase family DNA binding protein